MDLSPRVRSVCDLNVAEMREYSGRHEYDGRPQDLSPAGVRAGLARLAATRADGERVADSYDEAQLAAAEDLQRVSFAELEQYRRNPMPHLAELDLACYDKDYAPAAERDAARAEHLAAWPRVIDAAIESARPGECRRWRRRCWAPSGGWPLPDCALQTGQGTLTGRDAGLWPGTPVRRQRPMPGPAFARRPSPRTRGWSLTWSGRRRRATRIPRSAAPRSPR